MFLTSNPFTANSAAFQDVPGTQVDQLLDAGIPHKFRWESIYWQIRELGKLGSLRFQVLASVDGTDWTVLAGVVPNPTEGEVNEPDLAPGGLVQFYLTNAGDPILMGYRFFKVQVLSPSGDPTRYGVALVQMYAR